MCSNNLKVLYALLLIVPLLILLVLKDRNVAQSHYGSSKIRKNGNTKNETWTSSSTTNASTASNQSAPLTASNGFLAANRVPREVILERYTNNSITSAAAPSNSETSLPKNITIHNDSFAGCILTMDDYYRLPEFIAYHYHVLPLRYLVVAVDPNSKYDPNPIFKRFRTRLNMTIIVWNDTDVAAGDPFFLRKITPNATADYYLKKMQYIMRQRRFLQVCMAHMKDMGRAWTMLWDVDEFIVPSNQTGRRPAQPGLAAAPTLNLTEPGSVLSYLQNKGGDDVACVPMYRTLVGANETDRGMLANETYAPFDLNQFDTLRFPFRSEGSNGFGKSMLNIQKITKFPVSVKNPHRPATDICPRPVMKTTEHSPFYLNHYISSWEAYSFRDDSRKGGEKSRSKYMQSAFAPNVYNDVIASWFAGFVASVGLDSAQYVLQEAGLPKNYTANASKIDEFACVVGACTTTRRRRLQALLPGLWFG